MAASTQVLFRDELSEALGEPVEHAQRFFPGDRQMHVGVVPRLFRRVRGKGRLDDSLPSFAVAMLAVTPTRVAVYETSTRTGAFALTQVFAIWRREQITATAQRVTL